MVTRCWADVYLQMEHKQIEKCAVKPRLTHDLKNHAIKEINSLTALVKSGTKWIPLV